MGPPRRAKVDTGLAIVVEWGPIVANIAQFAPFPYAAQLITLTMSVLATIQRVRDNKAAFKQLADDLRDLVRAVLEARVVSVEMEQILEKLASVLVEINDFVLEHISHNRVRRMMMSMMDASKIQDYRLHIKQALDLFMLQSQIGIHEKVTQISMVLESILDVSTHPQMSSSRAVRFQNSTPSVASSTRMKDGGMDVPRRPDNLADAPSLSLNDFTTHQSSTSTVIESHSSVPSIVPQRHGRPDVQLRPSEPGPVGSVDRPQRHCSLESVFAPPETLLSRAIDSSSPLPSASAPVSSGAITHDADTTNRIPDDLYRNVEQNPHLRSILGVIIVFQETPSVLQVSRVLGLQWTDVRTELKPILRYFDGLDTTINYNSNVRLRQPLKEEVLQLIGTSQKYHGLVAQWCLVGPTPDARDVFYAADFWDYHVRNANASTDLYNALRNSKRPMNPTSRSKLPGIIDWLEKNGGAEAADFLSMFREHGNKAPQPVTIMGGTLSMRF
ncbi:hypothetical protein MVEN_01573500 [Mycena venus]|uniref:Uncharacterized protein n=1 Tax=Mycena venus TaxID=2733690 RepID=A0A8H6XQC8_9AGAR|nr:hypothetical protein MVEN_01573500 [Mycena venus]